MNVFRSIEPFGHFWRQKKTRVRTETSGFFSTITQSTTQPGETLIFSDALGHPTTAAIEIEDVTMAEIVADVAMGGKTYLGKTVRLEAIVLTDTVLAEGIISLSTGNETVNFFIIEFVNPEKLDTYKSLLTYTFTLYIEQITEVENEPGTFSIAAGIADD